MKTRTTQELVELFKKGEQVGERDVAQGWLAVVNDLQWMKKQVKGKQGLLTEKDEGKLEKKRKEFEVLIKKLEKYSKKHSDENAVHDMLGNTPWHGLVELTVHMLHDKKWKRNISYAGLRERIDHLSLHSLALIEAMGHEDIIPKKMRKVKISAGQLKQFLLKHHRRLGHIDFSPYNLAKKSSHVDTEFTVEHNLKKRETLVLSPFDLFRLDREVSDRERSIMFKIGLSEYNKLLKNKDNEIIRRMAKNNAEAKKLAKDIGKMPYRSLHRLILLANCPDVLHDMKVVEAALKRGEWKKGDKLKNFVYEKWRKEGNTPESIAESLYMPLSGENLQYSPEESLGRTEYWERATGAWPRWHKDLSEESVSDVLLGVAAMDENHSFGEMKEHLKHVEFDKGAHAAHCLIVDTIMKHDPGSKFRAKIKLKVKKNKEGGTDVTVACNDLGALNGNMGWMLGSGRSHRLIEEMRTRGGKPRWKKKQKTEHGVRGTTTKLFRIGKVTRKR